MFQPGDVAEFLALQRLGSRVNETMQFLCPDIYGLMGFFLLPESSRKASDSRASTYC